jgi:transposase
MSNLCVSLKLAMDPCGRDGSYAGERTFAGRRIATRYEKRAQSYLTMLHIAAIMLRL